MGTVQLRRLGESHVGKVQSISADQSFILYITVTFGKVRTILVIRKSLGNFIQIGQHKRRLGKPISNHIKPISHLPGLRLLTRVKFLSVNDHGRLLVL